MKLKHVRLSDKGKEIMNDKKLAGKIIKAIAEHGEEIHNGGSVLVENILIQSATNPKHYGIKN